MNKGVFEPVSGSEERNRAVSSLAGDDVDDDGGADEGRNGIEGDDATLAWEETDKVADEGHDGTTEDGGG